MLFQELQNIGLTDKQAKVYLAALELGEASVLEIAKKSGVNRATCYQAIEKLKNEGLVKEIKKNGKIKIVAEMPKKLLEILMDKRIKTERQIITLKKILPELESLYNYSETKPKIRFFEGLDGLKEIYQDTLKGRHKEILAFTAYHRADKELARWLDKYYIPERIKRNILARVIAPVSGFAQKYKQEDKKHKRQTLLIPAGKFPLSIEINIYGHKVAIISFVKQEMVGVVMESKEVANTFRLIFQLAWRGAEDFDN